MSACSGWLTLHPSQYLTLSTRTLAELNTYLRQTYNEQDDEEVDKRYRAVVDCNFCLGIATSVSAFSVRVAANKACSDD